MNDLIFNCSNMSKSYKDGGTPVRVLDHIDFKLYPGDRVAITGTSGSGKSTLLHLMGGLDKPDQGQICIQGIDWQSVSEKRRCQLRNHQLGFIYQFHHLLPEFTAMENVAMPLLLGHAAVPFAKEQALTMLEKVGLSHRVSHKPSQLSGGERQRVAIARALVHKPLCVLADEPTGNLDNATAAKVFDLMLELNKDLNTALVIVTHDQNLAARMDKIFTIHEGRLINNQRVQVCVEKE